jgi:CTP-dependent riboflavin kinase
MPRQAKLNTTEKRIVTAFTNLVTRRRLNPTTVIKTVTKPVVKEFVPTKNEITRWIKSVNAHRRVVTTIGESGRLTVFTMKGLQQKQTHARTIRNLKANKRA